MQIVRCVACDGYGWQSDDFTGEVGDCDWCDATGYVYRDADGVDHRIPAADYGHVAAILEGLETERLHEMGYTGGAVHPDEQAIRQGIDPTPQPPTPLHGEGEQKNPVQPGGEDDQLR
ncbi:MAG: hypothetical protein H7Y11_06335 [Armatimonadetes bacterium]|nr:hypothetical protein [Anaerolineae bacterium]